ncbi:MAG: hypothetical protein J6T14_01485 [Clostridia bacterium]|nr:hypothetical protein [Clostridia bacterium]
MSIYHRHMTMPDEETILRRKQYLEKLCRKLEARIENARSSGRSSSRMRRFERTG